MRRTVVVAALVLLPAVGTTMPAAATHNCYGEIDALLNTAETYCAVHVEHVVPGSGGAVAVDDGPTLVSTGSSPAVPMRTVAVGEEDENGETCVRAVFIPVEQEPPPESIGVEFNLNRCPPTPADEAGGAAVVDPQVIAFDVWADRPRPQPTPQVPPGHSIVGLPAYLVSGATMTDAFGTETAAGPLRIDATSQLWVDWGDGTGMTGPWTTPGRPYPNGDIAHTYQHRGTYTITVVQRWHVRWAYDHAAGSFWQDAPPVTITDHPVREVQAVVN
jgi:hypothetical protein